MKRLLAVLVLAGCALPVGCNRAEQQTANPAPIAAPVLSINAEMVGVVDHAAHVLWAVEREGHAPKNDDDWAEVEDGAVQLAAAGTLIVLGGTGPADAGWTQLPDWKKFARELTDSALLARSAAQAKNLDALVKANNQIVDVCEGCHKQFKPELPTERIVHRHRSQ